MRKLTVLWLTLMILFSSLCLSGLSFEARAMKYENRYATIYVEYSLDRTVPGSESYKTGEITLELYEQRAPITTANFIMLAQAGFYDDLIFHRVIDDFVIQGGDPNTRDRSLGPVSWWDDGNGGSEETIPLESHLELTHIDGAIGMARELGDPDSASSQFYICDGPQHRLDDTEENNQNRTFSAIDDRGYAVFGAVVSGIEFVREIATVWTTTGEEQETPDPLPNIALHAHDHPMFDARIVTVEISPLKEVARDEAEFPYVFVGILAVLGTGAVLLFVKKKGVWFLNQRRFP